MISVFSPISSPSPPRLRNSSVASGYSSTGGIALSYEGSIRLDRYIDRADRQGEGQRADPDLVAVADLGLFVPERPAVEEGAVGAPEVAEDQPASPALEAGVRPAHGHRPEAELAVRPPADDELRGPDRDRPARRGAVLDDEADAGHGGGLLGSVRADVLGPHQGGQDRDGKRAEVGLYRPGAFQSRGDVGADLDLAAEPGDLEDRRHLRPEARDLHGSPLGPGAATDDPGDRAGGPGREPLDAREVEDQPPVTRLDQRDQVAVELVQVLLADQGLVGQRDHREPLPPREPEPRPAAGRRRGAGRCRPRVPGRVRLLHQAEPLERLEPVGPGRRGVPVVERADDPLLDPSPVEGVIGRGLRLRDRDGLAMPGSVMNVSLRGSGQARGLDGPPLVEVAAVLDSRWFGHARVSRGPGKGCTFPGFGFGGPSSIASRPGRRGWPDGLDADPARSRRPVTGGQSLSGARVAFDASRCSTRREPGVDLARKSAAPDRFPGRGVQPALPGSCMEQHPLDPAGALVRPGMTDQPIGSPADRSRGDASPGETVAGKQRITPARTRTGWRGRPGRARSGPRPRGGATGRGGRVLIDVGTTSRAAGPSGIAESADRIVVRRRASAAWPSRWWRSRRRGRERADGQLLRPFRSASAIHFRASSGRPGGAEAQAVAKGE